jgi:hypothetical protein
MRSAEMARHHSAPPLPAGPSPSPSPSGDMAGESVLSPPPAVPRWVWVVTVAALAIFATGSLLRLFGPLPARSHDPARPAPAVGADVPSETEATPADSPADQTDDIPAGMLVIRHADGSPWFLVDKRPVSNSEYAAMFPSHDAGNHTDEQSVTRISYRYARSYAEAKGRRLPTAEEWRRAAEQPEFISPDGLWEWVAPDDDAGGDTRPVQSPAGSAGRSAAGGKDIGFRLARDP